MKIIPVIVLIVGFYNALVTAGAGNTEKNKTTQLCEIQNIPWTSLYSGVYYRGGTTTPKGGILSYDFKSLLLQVDAIPYGTHKFEEEWFGVDQWMFKQTPDFPGWYELRVRFIPEGLAALSSNKTENGYYLKIATKPEELKRLGVGGDLREDALWKVAVVGDNDEYYQIKHKRFPQGVVTHVDGLTDKNQNSSHYLQIVTNSNHTQFYKKGQKWYDDTLFTFKSPSLPTPSP